MSLRDIPGNAIAKTCIEIKRNYVKKFERISATQNHPLYW